MPALGSSLSIRFTAPQLQLLLTGLNQVLWSSHSQLAITNDNPETCGCTFCHFHTELLQLRNLVANARDLRRYRFRLNIFQILLCQLTLRNVAHPTKALRAEFDRIPNSARHRKLWSKLENLRRRARRQFLKDHGNAGYDEFAASWRDYLDCLRQKLSGRLPKCLRPRKRGTPRWETLLIDSLQQAVIWEFERTGFHPPPLKSLRHFTRLFLRYIRRGRIPLWIRDCARDPDGVAPELTSFVRTRIHKEKRNV